MRLLVRVLVAVVANQLTGRGERTVTSLAFVRPRAGVRIGVIVQRRPCLEAFFADGALERTFLRVAFHVARQQIPFGRGVRTVAAHVGDIVHTFIVAMAFGLGFVLIVVFHLELVDLQECEIGLEIMRKRLAFCDLPLPLPPLPRPDDLRHHPRPPLTWRHPRAAHHRPPPRRNIRSAPPSDLPRA